MKKQKLTNMPITLEYKTRLNTPTNSQKAKSQINNAQGHNILQHQYNDQHQSDCTSHNNGKDSKLQRTANLLKRVRSVRRMHIQDNQEGKWQDIKLFLDEAYYKRIEMEENINKQFRYDRRHYQKDEKYLQREEVQLHDQQLKKLLKEVKGLNNELNRIEVEKESLIEFIGRLSTENERLRVEMVDNKQKIQKLKTQYHVSEKYSMQKLYELQEFIQNLEEQNEELQCQIQELRQNHSKEQQKSEQMQMLSRILTITVLPTSSRDMQLLQRQFKDLKSDILNMQKKHMANINLLKKQHQKEIFTLRNHYFKNLNFYRNLIKKWSSHKITDSLRQPEEILKTDLIEMDQDLEDIDIDDTLETNPAEIINQ